MADGVNPSWEMPQAWQHHHVPHHPAARAGGSPHPASGKQRRVPWAAGELTAAPTTAVLVPGPLQEQPWLWHGHRGGTEELGCAGSTGRAVWDGAVAGLVLPKPTGTRKRGCLLASGAFGRCQPAPA